MKIRILAILLFWGFQAPAWAYTDQVTVKAEEAWQAAQEVLKQSGLKKVDETKKTLETKWIHDRVVRRGKGVFKNITSQTYDRRYRLTVRIVQRPFDTEIEVKGFFQERPVTGNPNHLLWKKVRPQIDDLDVERTFFMRILNRLELARANA
jgi:uncharacterized lipoprotein